MNWVSTTKSVVHFVLFKIFIDATFSQHWLNAESASQAIGQYCASTGIKATDLHYQEI